MAKQVMHLRDDIRKTFTTYALIPVFIISLISMALAFTYWNKNVLERNHESSALVGEALTTIVGSYQEKCQQIALACDLPTLANSTAVQTKLYQELYAQINILHANADFYILDEATRMIISSKVDKPKFLDIPGNTAWGIIGQLRQSPDRSVLSFISENDDFRNCSLAIGQAVVRQGEICGYVIFVIPDTYLLQVIANPYVQFVISDRFDYMPLATNYIFSNMTMNKMRAELRNVNGYFSHDKQQYYMTKRDILDGELSVYAITPIGSMVSQYITAVIILLGVLVILTVTIVISVKRQTVEKTKVIDQLVEAFAAVKEGNLDTRLNIKTNNEFEIIAEAYNTMLCSLKDLMRLNNEKARETVISEIKQLESQFNPHFLFNTLENVKFMIKLDPTAAGKMIVALLRYSINNKIGEVTIREDMEYTQNYLDIQQARFGDRLVYKLTADDAVKDYIVPKLIFQPIIENAIKYGAAADGAIRIEMEIWRNQDCLEILVFNSGQGMSAAKLAEVNEILAAKANMTQHTGIYNVHRRIQLIYGSAYGVEISSEKAIGTTVRIVLPLRC